MPKKPFGCFRIDKSHFLIEALEINTRKVYKQIISTFSSILEMWKTKKKKTQELIEKFRNKTKFNFSTKGPDVKFDTYIFVD